MDLDAVAEWSRYVVVVAVLGYLAAWLAFCAEAAGPWRADAPPPRRASTSRRRGGRREKKPG